MQKNIFSTFLHFFTVTYHPNSTIARLWQVLLLFSWTYSLLILPFIMGFVVRVSPIIFLLDFTCDMILFMHTIYMAPRLQHFDKGEFITDHHELKRRYFQGDFRFDLLCSIPIDTVFEVLFFMHSLFSNTYDKHNNSYYGGLLFVALLRLPKFLLLARVIEFFKQMLIRLSSVYNPNYIRIAYMVLFIFLVTHWISCAWFLLARVEGFGVTSFLPPKKWEKVPIAEKYFYAITWAFSKITSLDTNTDAPDTVVEQAFQIILCIASITAYASMFYQTGCIIMSLDESEQRITEKQERLNNFLRKHNIPHNVRESVKSYYDYKLNHEQAEDELEILKELPESLRASIFMNLRRNFLLKVPFLRNCSEGFLQHLIVKLQTVVLPPSSIVIACNEEPLGMYFLNKGEVEILTPNGDHLATLGSGQYFGEMSLLENRPTHATVKTISFCEMFKLSKEDFNSFLNESGEVEFTKSVQEYYLQLKQQA